VLTPTRWLMLSIATSFILGFFFWDYLPASQLNCFPGWESKAAVLLLVAIVLFFPAALISTALLAFILSMTSGLHIATNYYPRLLTFSVIGIFALILADPAWGMAARLQTPVGFILFVFCLFFVGFHLSRSFARMTWGDIGTSNWRWGRHFLNILSLGFGYVIFPGSLIVALLAPGFADVLGTESSDCAYRLAWCMSAASDDSQSELVLPYAYKAWNSASKDRCNEPVFPDDFSWRSENRDETCDASPFLGVLPRFISVTVDIDRTMGRGWRIELLFPLQVLFVWAPLALLLGVLGQSISDRLTGAAEERDESG